jgi:hypothetical protein
MLPSPGSTSASSTLYSQVSAFLNTNNVNKPNPPIACESVKEMEEYFNQADDKTLVIFDINYTLTMPNDPALQKKSLTEHKVIFGKSFKDLTPAGSGILGAVFIANTTPVLVDSDFPAAFHKLQQKKAKVIALSSSTVGPIGDTTVQEILYQRLKELGIQFLDVFEKEKKFESLGKDFRGQSPIFYKGIALTNREITTKGKVGLEVLKALKEKLNPWNPDKAILVEDLGNNLPELKKALESQGIACRTINFTGAQKYPRESVSQEQFQKSWFSIVETAKEIVKQLGHEFYQKKE